MLLHWVNTTYHGQVVTMGTGENTHRVWLRGGARIRTNALEKAAHHRHHRRSTTCNGPRQLSQQPHATFCQGDRLMQYCIGESVAACIGTHLSICSTVQRWPIGSVSRRNSWFLHSTSTRVLSCGCSFVTSSSGAGTRQQLNMNLYMRMHSACPPRIVSGGRLSLCDGWKSQYNNRWGGSNNPRPRDHDMQAQPHTTR